MEFWAAFFRALRSRPLAALGALYWRATGRKVRARNRLRITLSQSSQAYQIWIDTIERRDEAVADAPAVMAGWKHTPRFSIILDHASEWSARDRDALLRTLETQVHSDFEVIAVAPSGSSHLGDRRAMPITVVETSADDEAAAFLQALERASGTWIVFLRPGALLNPASLYWLAEAIQEHPDAALFYGDNDWINPEGRRHRPWFKPKWNTDLALAQDYVCQMMAVSSQTVRTVTDRLDRDGKQVAYAICLAIGQTTPDAVVHVPHILCHLTRGNEADFQEERLAVVQAHLDRLDERGARAEVGDHGTIQVLWPAPQPEPLVTIIIPTRDKVTLLRACVSSLLEKTSHAEYEIIVVDNGSREKSALTYLAEISRCPNIRILRDDRPYNFSQLNNRAVSEANGEYICLLNNDTEIINGEWLRAMLRHARRPHVGAVGAKLLYADGTIQHAGVVVGLGGAAGHAHRFEAANDAGYFARSHAAHGVSAVTAACLLVSKRKYLQVGGLDEESLAVAFNDVDFCLKLGKAGWQNLFVPQAILYHHESKSRGNNISRRHIQRDRLEFDCLQKRWGASQFQDPLHHRYLDRSMEQYRVRL